MQAQSSVINHRSSMRTGAVLTLVIVALALTGVVMFVLTQGSNAMLFRTDTAYLQALERDLIASGLALARQKVSAGLPTDELSDLDVAALGVPNGRLLVRVLEVQNDQARVHIETSCRKGRRTLDTSRDFTILLREPSQQI